MQAQPHSGPRSPLVGAGDLEVQRLDSIIQGHLLAGLRLGEKTSKVLHLRDTQSRERNTGKQRWTCVHVQLGHGGYEVVSTAANPAATPARVLLLTVTFAALPLGKEPLKTQLAPWLLMPVYKVTLKVVFVVAASMGGNAPDAVMYNVAGLELHRRSSRSCTM